MSQQEGRKWKLRLSAYDEKWIMMYETEVQILSAAFGNELLKFEHFGSTSVPEMKAKPVIDMLGLVKDIQKIDEYNEEMELLGYEAAGEWGIAGRRLFRKGGESRTHHLHVYQYDNPQIDRHLIVRDYLRKHYSNLKEELARHYTHTSQYSKAKGAYVQELEQRALNWFSTKDGAEISNGKDLESETDK
ncbi:GrpB family protein [Oceanobacillus massiliensis]|uniref:GrpB family protein n=1 Tax=Oceanobacillus massiliensis TaxID=1465765 RepID=UPI0030178BB9